MSNKKLSRAVVIIPTYNERENIQRTITALLAVFDQIKTWDMQVLVVDDTSPDKTYEVVKQLSKKDSRVHLELNPKKSGLGGAYLRGMKVATEKLDAEVVFEFDADLSHDPVKIPQFLEALESGADMVLGSRYIPGGSIPDNWGFHRKFLSVVGNVVIMIIFTDLRVRDWTSGYRAIRKEVYHAVKGELSSERFSGYTFQIGFLYTALQRGYKVVEVPFKFVDREIGYSKLGPEYIINNLLFILKMRIESILQNRVFKFAMVGGIGALVQLISLSLWRMVIPIFELANLMSIETAIVSNFILSNTWTFADKKLHPRQYLPKFIQFNLASSGSIIIQSIIALLGARIIGLIPLFVLPVVGLLIDTGHVYAVIGIFVGMFWNYFAYDKIIWRSKKNKR